MLPSYKDAGQQQQQQPSTIHVQPQQPSASAEHHVSGVVSVGCLVAALPPSPSGSIILLNGCPPLPPAG